MSLFDWIYDYATRDRNVLLTERCIEFGCVRRATWSWILQTDGRRLFGFCDEHAREWIARRDCEGMEARAET